MLAIILDRVESSWIIFSYILYKTKTTKLTLNILGNALSILRAVMQSVEFWQQRVPQCDSLPWQRLQLHLLVFQAEEVALDGRVAAPQHIIAVRVRRRVPINKNKVRPHFYFYGLKNSAQLTLGEWSWSRSVWPPRPSGPRPRTAAARAPSPADSGPWGWSGRCRRWRRTSWCPSERPGRIWAATGCCPESRRTRPARRSARPSGWQLCERERGTWRQNTSIHATHKKISF